MPISFLSPMVAFVITMASIFMLKPLATRFGLLDIPGGRKHHEKAIPLIGGFGMFLGFGFALLTLDISLSAYRCLIAGSVLLVLTGLLDDFHELTPRSRLFVQVFIATLMVWWANLSLQSFGNLLGFGDISLGYFAFPITILATVGVINAVNMTDGTDGLAGTVALIEFFYLGCLAHHAHQGADEQIIRLIIVSILAFLCFNFPWRQRASVFMGDSGSMFLGFLLVWFCVSLSQLPAQAAPPVVFLWVLAMPLWDISYVVWHRLVRGRSPFQADRGHLHHYLGLRGCSPLQITLIIGLCTTIVGFIGMVGVRYHISEGIMFTGFLLAFMLYVIVLQKGWKALPQ